MSLLISCCKLEPSVVNVNSLPGKVKIVDIEKTVCYKDDFRPLSLSVVNLQGSQSTS